MLARAEEVSLRMIRVRGTFVINKTRIQITDDEVVIDNEMIQGLHIGGNTIVKRKQPIVIDAHGFGIG